MSYRILRVNELIQRELNQIFLREIELPTNVLVTITRVETADNFSEAKVYISCLPETETFEIMHILEKNIYDIQQHLNHRLTMRMVPKIRFVEEIKTKEAGRIENLLRKIKRGKRV